MARQKTHRDGVILAAYSIDDRPIEQVEIHYDEFYEETVPLIDSDSYRAKRKVRRVVREFYKSNGALQQSFVNTYDARGRYVRSRSEFDDGTVAED